MKCRNERSGVLPHGRVIRDWITSAAIGSQRKAPVIQSGMLVLIAQNLVRESMARNSQVVLQYEGLRQPGHCSKPARDSMALIIGEAVSCIERDTVVHRVKLTNLMDEGVERSTLLVDFSLVPGGRCQ